MTIIETSSLKPPFAREKSITIPVRVGPESNTTPNNIQGQSTTAISARLSATYHSQDPSRNEINLKRIDQSIPGSVYGYLQEMLDVSRLNKIENYLWTAGLPRIACPLHKQLEKGRTIIVTEQADCHLVWQDDQILIKPLPEILLDHRAWEVYLSEPNQTREAACGFILSYLWLICQESDFHIAKHHNLLPEFVEWSAWSDFAGSAYDHLHDRDSGKLKVPVSQRYSYGELRLSRLNKIYRFIVALPRGDIRTLILGYNYTYTTYQSFFQRNTGWLVSLVVYMGLVLEAMQLGLTTRELQYNSAFDLACYGFTVFAILAPLIVLGGGLLTLLILFFFHAKHALWQHKKHAAAGRKLQIES
ncbi:hypothetical protein H2200_013180 [Cladophialophora chaetospira]|uniref:Subtilisin-like serine protease n=1 Tax=Cladophialophora chaetospira TaxID=386627 RepID=A0AA38WWB5_9EURO|nr:hypothetical protein H2200_013180 [Cladophialophora chaetospira]